MPSDAAHSLPASPRPQPEVPGGAAAGAHRAEIDGLRAIAVGAVVAYHAAPSLVRGGFVGVDVFFVISGCLITGILLRSLEARTFSLADFYARRVRRIVPALGLVMAVTCAAGWALLLGPEYAQLGRHTAWSAAFAANVVLWNEAGSYFDNAADTKPLLHLWSLGVEEQYYLAFPLILGLSWLARAHVWATAALLAASFALNLAIVRTDAVTAFYLPVTRFWEMLAGSLVALAAAGRPVGLTNDRRASDALAAVGVATIAGATLLFDATAPFPGWRAAVPVLGAAMVLAAGPSAAVCRHVLAHRALRFLGEISYPLYLWHWPILSFGRILTGAPLPWPAATVAVAASVALAWATSRLEARLRYGRHLGAKTVALVVVLVGVGVGGHAIDAHRGFDGRASVRQAARFAEALAWDAEIDPACAAVYRAEPLTFCATTSATPEVLVLGDSHANQLEPGLARELAGKLSVMTVGNGPPLDGVRFALEGVNPRHAWLRGPASHADTRRFIEREGNALEVAVVGGMWDAVTNGTFVGPDGKPGRRAITLVPDAPGEAGAADEEIVARALARTLRWLLAHGVRPVLVTDPPEIGLDVRACGRPGRALFGDPCDRPVSRADVDARQRPFRRVLARIRRELPEVVVFDTLPLFCDERRCRVLDEDGTPLYRDEAHLSRRGSELVARALGPVVLQTARAPRPRGSAE